MILPPLAIRSRFCFDQRLSLTLEISALNAASNGDIDGRIYRDVIQLSFYGRAFERAGSGTYFSVAARNCQAI